MKTYFWSILEVTDGKAKALAKLLIRFLKACKIDKMKLLHFTSDGASVMLGQNNGMAALLRNHYGISHLMDFHCVAHREALAMKDVLNVNLYTCNFYFYPL